MACKICRHEQRHDIERDIRDGMTFRAVAEKYGDFSRNIVSKHQNLCMVAIEDARIEEAKAAVVEAHVTQYDGMAQIPQKWNMLEQKYQEMLKEAESGPDFSDDVLNAIDLLTNGDRAEAIKLLTELGQLLAGDRKDRRDTLREMRSLYDNQIQAMARLEELRSNRKQNLIQSSEWADLRTEIVGIVSKCKKCSQALAEALSERVT